jgi:hypothetical protein
MTRFLFFFLFILFSSVLKSQCFQIQSILVDACDGPNEGKNEMVVFKVGSTALNTANLSVNWPNNTWLGLTKNASTAADVATVNATIVGCGLLKEPIAGVLPANSKVLLVTSTAWTPLAQSFVNLNDTFYVIFQTAGNTAGHFANYQSAGGLRTLTMTFSVPASCTDAVTYDRALLTNQAGNIGAQDGGAVEFTSAGVPSYVNHGCQAPFIPLSVDAGSDKTICSANTQTFSATASGVYTSINWSLGAGATGTFVPSNSVTTTYNPGAGDNGTVKLYVTITKSCGAQTTTVKDSVNLTITPTPTLTIDFSNVSLCTGQIATVSASSSEGNYLWSPGSVTTNTLLVNAPGIYTVTTSNNCYTTTATTTVTINSAPTLSISSTSSSLCASGQTAILSLSGSTGVYNWSNGSSTSTTSVNAPGVYTATVTTPSCGSTVSSFTVNAIVTPTISLSSSSSSGGSAPYTWSNSSNTGSVVTTNGGTVTVSNTNACGTQQHLSLLMLQI